jgi:PAT family beta-lactamase induction signal transducer AmpG
MAMSLSEMLTALGNRRMRAMLLLGFASGLPLALSGGTLQAWLATTSVQVHTIGLFSLVGLPYTIKFIWSPVMDRFVPPFLGRRRGWILITQGLLIVLILAIGMSSPAQTTLLVGVLALLLAFASASQDISIDAYRTDVLHPEERGFGAALSVAGYRVAMLVSSGLALIMADHLGWSATYTLMAVLLFIGVAAALFGPEPEVQATPPASLQEAVVAPFIEFFSRRAAVWLLLLIILYKLGDAFAGTLTTTFLLRGLGFSLTEVGVVNKWLGLAATIFGGLAGGILMMRWGLYRCLLWFGLLQAVTNLGFMVLAMIGKSFVGMVAVIGMENLAGGMGTAVFVGLLISLCNHRYSATQYALLSSLAAIGRVFVGPPSGYLVEATGWAPFFLVTFAVSLPGLLLLVALRGTITAYEKKE